MSVHYCLLCASDEGIFLDVTSDNQSIFGDQLETCLTTKINENIELSNKVCYKCAYELDQCTKFVKKYKVSHEISRSEEQAAISTCCLCLELVDKDRIFDINKDCRAIFSPLQKIRNIFNEDLAKKVSSKLICLECRYNLDVLYDLKKIYQETATNLKSLINKEIDYTSFPKVHTDVVNRKTTITTFPDITFYASLSSDSECNDGNMSRSKSRVSKRNASRGKAKNKPRKDTQTKVRTCDECHNIVANGSDMYRFHRTGLTVCKACWVTMEPIKSKGKRRPRNTETKLCTVFLTDVLSEGSRKDEQRYKLEKDEDGNKLYLISDDSSEDRSSESSQLSVTPKSQNHVQIDSGPKKRGKKRLIDANKSDVENTPSKVVKPDTETIRTATKSAKLAPSTPEREQSPNTPVTRQTPKKKVSTAGSDSSDVSQLMSRETRAHTLNDRAKLASSSLPADNTKRSGRKRLRSECDEATHSEHSEDSSNENGHEIGTRRKKSATSARVTPMIKWEAELKGRETRNRTRSSSISSVEIIGFKSPKSVDVVKTSSETKLEYTCDKCSKKFDSKISSAEHRLTHLKQVTLKLERIDCEEKREEAKAASREHNETDKEAEAVSSKTTVDTTDTAKHDNDATEEIAINVEDDTDDEEIFTLTANKIRIEKELKRVMCGEKSEESGKPDVASDKLDTAEDESQRAEVESTGTQDEIRDVVTNESKQRRESTSDRLANETEKEDTKDENEKAQEMRTLIDDANDVSNEDMIDIATVASAEHEQDMEKCEAIQTEDDARMLIEKEKEQSVSECNDDAKNDVEEATTRVETMESPVHSNTTKNEDGSCANKPENNCQDSKDPLTDNIELTPDNPESESLKDNDDEDARKEKKNKTTSNITSKTNLSNDNKKHSDDVIVMMNEVEALAASEPQQQNTDELMEVDITADNKPNGIEEIATSDLLNHDKFDGEMANCIEDDGNDDDLIMVSLADNNDVAKAKRLSEEIILGDEEDPKENYRMEDGIKSLERLIKETVAGEEPYELGEQEEEVENSSHVVVNNNSATDAATEIMSEVFDLAAAEVQKRHEGKRTIKMNETDLETLENISREIHNSADMPSLDPINVMELDDDDDDNNVIVDGDSIALN